jgi:1-acyl-sn-glycerol-3-phosphate acyltransferase
LNQTSQITRVYRSFRLLQHIISGLAIATFIWPLINQKTKLKLTKWWCRGLLRCFNIRMVTHGSLPDATTSSTKFMANHISWIDIHAINSVIPLRFIAKSEVGSWPVFGYLIKKSGTLFIDRNRKKDAARIVAIAAQSLKNGDNLGFFPEGTTTDGTYLLPFKSSIVQAAIDAEAKIWPVAIRYPQPNGNENTHIAYAGDTTLGESILSLLKQKTLWLNYIF